MWQTIVVLLLLAGVLVYVIRHYVQVYRSDVPTCSGCSGCGGVSPKERQGECPQEHAECDGQSAERWSR